MPNAVSRVSTPPAGTSGATHSSRRGATGPVAMASPSRSGRGHCTSASVGAAPGRGSYDSHGPGGVGGPAHPPPRRSLGRRLVLAGLLGRVGLLLGAVHRAVGVLRRAVDGVEDQGVRAGVDEVVLRAGGDDDEVALRHLSLAGRESRY